VTGHDPASHGGPAPDVGAPDVGAPDVGGPGVTGQAPAGIRALAVTVSNRAAAGVYEDRSGPVLARLLAEAGCTVDGPLVVPDGEPVEAALRDAVAAGYQVVVTTGGTGLTPGDLTPEMTRRVLDREIPGIAEAIRSAGLAAGVPAAMLSRGLAGLAGRVLIVNLAGSTGGVRDGMAVLAPVLRHAIDQAHGGDHPRPGTAG
jgi:molybdenum cofactor synthesis domain-containing protein